MIPTNIHCNKHPPQNCKKKKYPPTLGFLFFSPRETWWDLKYLPQSVITTHCRRPRERCGTDGYWAIKSPTHNSNIRTDKQNHLPAFSHRGCQPSHAKATSLLIQRLPAFSYRGCQPSHTEAASLLIQRLPAFLYRG